MLEVHVVASNRLRNYRPMAIPILELSLPWHGTVLSVPVGAVNTPQHVGESSFLIFSHLCRDRLGSPDTHICGSISRIQIITECVKFFFGNTLLDAGVKMNGIKCNPVCEYS